MYLSSSHIVSSYSLQTFVIPLFNNWIKSCDPFPCKQLLLHSNVG